MVMIAPSCMEEAEKMPRTSHPLSRRMSAALLAIGLAAFIPARSGAEETETAKPEGYLKKHELPDSLSLLPPPPRPDTPAFAENDEMHRRAARLRHTPRWELAKQDADLREGGAITAFSCALGVQIDAQQTPRLHMLLMRAMRDTSRSTRAAKTHYAFTRPFVARGETSCTPHKEDSLRSNGSYPSAHAARGWTLALLLSELAPERANALMARGASYGESRMICNVHWYSDIQQARVMSHATLARLHSRADFMQDMEAARAELAAARAAGHAPRQDCAAQAKALQDSLTGTN